MALSYSNNKVLHFEKIDICKNTNSIINYPENEGEQFIVITNSGYYIHCIAILSLEDTCLGSEKMLICVPYDENYNYDICLFDCSHIAYL